LVASVEIETRFGSEMNVLNRGLWSLMLVLWVGGSAAAAPDVRLANAIERGDRETARALLGERVDVNTAQPDGATALHWATHWNDVELVDLLIQAGARVSAVNELGVPPLSLACTNGSPAIVQRLLGAGADPNASLPSGETVLMTAARTGSVDVIEALLARGADVNAAEHQRGQTALMWAVVEGHHEAMKVLIGRGADVHARTTRGSTPLLFAARTGDLEATRMLVAAGADVNEAEPVLRLPPDADPNETPPGGNSALLIASASLSATSGFEYSLAVKPSGHEAVAVFLLERGADPAKTDTIGTTPLHAAVQTGKVELVKALLAHGANPNALMTKAPPPLRGDFVDYNRYVGATPFWLAAAARVPNVEILRALVSSGADPHLTVRDGTTPLMAAVGMVQNDARLAAEASALEVVKVLVEIGADVNALGRTGQTALHGAARSGWNSVVQFLVDHGARLDIKDRQGRTPLAIAEDPIRPLESTAALLRKLASAQF
jgi:ankyrin repeat protein